MQRGDAMRSEASVPGQARSVPERAGSAARRRQTDASAGASPAAGAADLPDRRAKQVREWLFLLLRFAITRDPEDELAVLMMANGIDSLGRQWGRAAPSFFRRSSDEICRAIADIDDPKREAILKKHMRRIEHLGLRRAFQAAVHFEESVPPVRDRSHGGELWAGLQGGATPTAVRKTVPRRGA